VRETEKFALGIKGEGGSETKEWSKGLKRSLWYLHKLLRSSKRGATRMATFRLGGGIFTKGTRFGEGYKDLPKSRRVDRPEVHLSGEAAQRELYKEREGRVGEKIFSIGGKIVLWLCRKKSRSERTPSGYGDFHGEESTQKGDTCYAT